jgi:hypothetical protein
MGNKGMATFSTKSPCANSCDRLPPRSRAIAAIFVAWDGAGTASCGARSGPFSRRRIEDLNAIKT